MPTLLEELTVAVQFHQAGQLDAAEEIYRRVLASAPNQPDALHLLGLVAYQTGRHRRAIELMRRALQLGASGAIPHNNLGEAYRAVRRFPEAIAAYQRALELDPQFALAHNNMGLALQSQVLLDDARASYRAALRLNANYADAHNNLGTAWQASGQITEAMGCYRRALEINPEHVDANNNLGNALEKEGDLAGAIICYRLTLKLRPDYVGAYLNLGNALRDQGRVDEAICSYREALKRKPEYAEAFNSLGNALNAKGLLAEASGAFKSALRIKPDYAEAHNNLANVWKNQGMLADAVASYRRALECKPDFALAHSNLIYALHFCPGIDAHALFEEQGRWNRQHAEPVAQLSQPHENDPVSERRLRIGYVSPDFSLHPVGRFMLPLLEQHDHHAVEVFCYAAVRAWDGVTERSRACADVWRNTLGLSDAQLTQVIRQDKIDILVDLSMHTAENRLLVFARKPCPVQVTYLAYCGTTGLCAMDYRFTDAYLDPRPPEPVGPVGPMERPTEEPIWLPETYWCYRPPPEAPEAIALPASKTGHVTFGCLNNFAKVTQPTLLSWMRILQALPQARLLLHAHPGSHRVRVRELCAAHGIAPERLTFVEQTLPLSAYFKIYERMDVALDPFPFGGGTTTCDALWMGVPVVSLAGKTSVGRAGVSILSNVGLADLIAEDTGSYVRKATELANNLTRLRALRAGLRAQMQDSPLMDAPRFARSIEAAYRDMWQRWCRKQVL